MWVCVGGGARIPNRSFDCDRLLQILSPDHPAFFIPPEKQHLSLTAGDAYHGTRTLALDPETKKPLKFPTRELGVDGLSPYVFFPSALIFSCTLNTAHVRLVWEWFEREICGGLVMILWQCIFISSYSIVFFYGPQFGNVSIPDPDHLPIFSQKPLVKFGQCSIAVGLAGGSLMLHAGHPSSIVTGGDLWSPATPNPADRSHVPRPFRALVAHAVGL